MLYCAFSTDNTYDGAFTAAALHGRARHFSLIACSLEPSSSISLSSHPPAPPSLFSWITTVSWNRVTHSLHPPGTAAQCHSQTTSPASQAATAELATSPASQEPLVPSAHSQSRCLRPTRSRAPACSACSRHRQTPATLELCHSTGRIYRLCLAQLTHGEAIMLDFLGLLRIRLVIIIMLHPRRPRSARLASGTRSAVGLLPVCRVCRHLCLQYILEKQHCRCHHLRRISLAKLDLTR